MTCVTWLGEFLQCGRVSLNNSLEEVRNLWNGWPILVRIDGESYVIHTLVFTPSEAGYHSNNIVGPGIGQKAAKDVLHQVHCQWAQRLIAVCPWFSVTTANCDLVAQEMSWRKGKRVSLTIVIKVDIKRTALMLTHPRGFD